MKYILGFFIITITVCSCEDTITPELQEAPPILIVDAFLNNLDSIQTVRIAWSRPYFDDSPLDGVSDATVTVSNTNGTVLSFIEAARGVYQWDPSGSGPIAEVNDSLVLEIIIGEDLYQAGSKMNRVPDIDSVTFRFEEEDLFFPDSYFAEFWSRDIAGPGDTYWIKSYKNGEYLNQPSEINIAYDAGFSEGGNVDGLIFIPPIRDAINPFEEDEDDEFVSPFEDGDSVYVEIHSITNEAFLFLNDLRIQTDRPGGFAELFAVPLSNVRSNIVYLGNREPMVVAGFFNVAAVKSAGKKLEI